MKIKPNTKHLIMIKSFRTCLKKDLHNENKVSKYSITPRSCPEEIDMSRPSSGSFEDLSWHVQKLCNNAAKRICTKIL